MSNSKSECVRVAIRCRPLSRLEKEQGHQPVVSMDKRIGRVTVDDPTGAESTKEYTFDSVYDDKSSQEEIYNDAAFQIVESVLEGFNGTIFAYGQTGTGKTFTMVGSDEQGKTLQGIIPRTFEHIFNFIDSTPNREFHVRASFLEIYNEQIRDLLGRDHKAKLDLRDNPEKGAFVKGLSETVVSKAVDLQKIMDKGFANRAVASTNMNAESSRSHSIFTITIETRLEGHVRVGKLNMVDLAGSERQSKTGATGDQLKEATNINKSLSALGAVINALVDGKSSHIPYRDSKLTHLLKDSLGGNTKTVMVANVGPAGYNIVETLATLRYANRAKNIKNKPKINEDPKDTKLRAYEEEIAALKAQLEGGSAGGGVRGPMSEEERRQVAAEVEAEMQSKFEKLEKERRNIEQDKEKTQLEKDKLLEELKVKEKQVEKERKKREHDEKKAEEMQSRLLELEKQVLVGKETKKLAREQQKELIRNQEILKEKERQAAEAKEREMKEAQQRQQLAVECSTKDEMIAKLQSKFEKCMKKIQELEDEAALLEDEKREVEGKAQDANFKTTFFEHFIPNTVQEVLKMNMEFDKESNTYFVKNFRLSGKNLRARQPEPLLDGALRPITQLSCSVMNKHPNHHVVPFLRQKNFVDCSISTRPPIDSVLGDLAGNIPAEIKAAVEAAVVFDDVMYEVPDTTPPIYFQYDSSGAPVFGQNDLTVGANVSRFIEGVPQTNMSAGSSGGRSGSAVRPTSATAAGRR